MYCPVSDLTGRDSSANVAGSHVVQPYSPLNPAPCDEALFNRPEGTSSMPRSADTSSSDQYRFGTFTPSDVRVRVEPMLRIQGYTDLDRVRPKIRHVAQEMAALAERSFQPQAQFRRLRVEACADGVLQLETGTGFRSDAFAHFLSDSSEVVVFVLTVGAELDRVSQSAMDNEQLLEAVFLEAAGWLGIEAVTKQFNAHLRHLAAAQGFRLTRRISPGYSFKVGGQMHEWSLYQQVALFALFAGADPPVSVLESGAMLPKMSRSGLYGLRPAVT